MTYTAIAKHFAVVLQRLLLIVRTGSLERVRAQHQKEKYLDKPPEIKNVEQGTGAESTAPPSMVTVYEEKVNQLAATLFEKDEFI